MSDAVDIMVQTDIRTWLEDRSTNTSPLVSEDEAEGGDTTRMECVESCLPTSLSTSKISPFRKMPRKIAAKIRYKTHEKNEARSIRTRSDLTLTDLPTDRNSLLRERLRLLREEAELEDELQTVRSEALKAKRELLMKRIQYYKSQKGKDEDLSPL